MAGVTPTPQTPSALLASLQRNLPIATRTSMSGATPGNDLYEAYIFGLVLAAADNQGYSVQIRDYEGQGASVLHLRRSPGRLCNGVSQLGALFTHAVLSVANRPDLEVHTGVYVVGKSRVTHEADVLVLPATVARRCREARLDPPSSAAWLLVEAKYYTVPVTLGVGRQFLGLRHDTSAKNTVFVCTTAGSSASALLAGSPNVEADDGVLPRLSGESSLRSLLVRLFRTYRLRR
ncbi:MAG: hypothetical protein LBC97_09730 [Bifidobacteriaceae bacterium]|jgi:hypothetical protein|nr:hypothetical protein [Bifidobacteriaceae bacterium]